VQNELGPDAKAGQHVDERVDAEEVDPAAHPVAHPGLRAPKKFGRLGLLQSARGDHLLQVGHELGAHL